MSQEYNTLIHQLDTFIRKYYRNELLRGVLLTFFIFCISSFSAIVLEYFGHFEIMVRTILFYTIASAYLLVFLRFILWPLSKFLQIGKQITHKQAAAIISTHFTEIQDRLYNVLELAEMSENNGISQTLLNASIADKISGIRVLPFEAAINVKDNFKYLYYLGIALSLFFIVYFIWPQIIKDGSGRLINHSVYYAPAPPFQFILQNDSLNIEQGKDFEINLKIEGKYVPKNAYVEMGGNKILLERLTPTTFKYLIKNVNNSFDFHFTADEIESDNYRLSVLPAPVITGFRVEIDVPAYTGESDFVMENTGDFTIPCGSIVKWFFNTSNVENIRVLINDSVSKEVKKEDKQFQAYCRFLTSSSYSVFTSNSYIKSAQPVKYQVNVIPDLFPGINAEFIADTSQMGMYYFKGIINDDYGFNKLTFNYKISESDSLSVISVPINKNTKYQEFYFAFDFSSMKAQGNEIEYYFEIWDNDGVHGSKSSRSALKSYKIPSAEEMEQYRENANKNIAEKLKSSQNLSEEIKKDIKNLQQNLLNNKSNSWEQTKKLEDIVQKQNQLEQLIKQLSQENKQKDNFMNTFSEQDKQLIEKQKQIEDLLENLMDEDMKKMMEELKKLMENFDRNKLNNMAEQVKMNYEDMSKQLDRNLEMLKRLEIEEKTGNLTKELDKLSKDQDKLSEESTDKKNNTDSLNSKQDDQQKKFDELMKDYQDLQKKNEELKDPMNMKDFEREKNDINNEFKEGKENLNQKNRKGASKNQKNNAEKLKEMSQQMEQMMQESDMQQDGENEENLKQIIDNLEKFSFDQEALLGNTGKIGTTDPAYMKDVEKQKALMDDFKIIKDSLYALGNRSPMLGNEINKQLKKIDKLGSQTMNNYEERNTSQAKVNQQFIMTSANDLALLLGEVLQQMQNQSQQQCSGSKCKKPGKKGKPSLSEMQSMQKSLKSQMQSMIDDLKKGEGQKNGKEMNEKLGKMVSMQDKFNQMLNELMQNGGLSPEAAKQLKEIKSMVNDVEKDIINKNITPQTMMRQEQILTRLLEAEKSDRERETENKRESHEGKNDKLSNPEQIFKYKGVNSQYNEILEGSKIKLSKYYQDKYKEYMINLNE